MKKKALALLLAVATIGVFAGCTPKTQTPPANGTTPTGEKQTIVIATWGGVSETGLRKILAPFETENNVEFVYDIGNNSDRINKIRASKDNPTIDIALMTDCFSVMGNEEGLFETIDPANVPNLTNIYDFAQNKENFGPAYSVVTYGLVYDTEVFPTPPTSWNELWNDKLQISVPDITSTAGPMLLVKAAEMNGGGINNIDPGFAKMAELKNNIVNFYLSPTDVTAMFERKEISLVPFLDTFAKSMKDSGLPVSFTGTEDGAFAGFNTINIVKGTKNKVLCEKLVDYLLSTEIQNQVASVLLEAPVNPQAVVADDISEFMAYGEEKVSKLNFFDWSAINAAKPEWIERYNKEISNN